MAGSQPNCIELDCSANESALRESALRESALRESAASRLQEDGLQEDGLNAECLVERNYSAVYRYAYRLSGCSNAAEDITQEVFIKAIRHIDQLRVAEAELGWVLAITRREYLRWLRQISKPAAGRASVLEEADEPAEPVHEKNAENQDWVQSALSQLNADAQVVLLMYYFEELSYAEIASQLNIPIGTVMSRLSRARDHMRRILEKEVKHD